MINVQPDVADAVTLLCGVAACVRALIAPDTTAAKPKAISLKSGAAAATGGADMLSPKLRAARLLKALVGNCGAALAQLARPPTRASLLVRTSMTSICLISTGRLRLSFNFSALSELHSHASVCYTLCAAAS